MVFETNKNMDMNRRSRNISNISVVKDFVKEKKKPIKKVLSRTKTSFKNFQSFKRLNEDHRPNLESDNKENEENTVIKRR